MSKNARRSKEGKVKEGENKKRKSLIRSKTM